MSDLYEQLADSLREMKPKLPPDVAAADPHKFQQQRFNYRIELEQWRRDCTMVAAALAAEDRAFDYDAWRVKVEL
jgi:hypothetical protein